MTTKSGKLQLREKQRIEELIKCGRDRKRLHVLEALDEKRKGIEAPFDTKIEVLQRQIEVLQRQSENIRIERENAVVKAGYGKIHERGCYDTHPDLDNFDAETNKLLVALWERQS